MQTKTAQEQSIQITKGMAKKGKNLDLSSSEFDILLKNTLEIYCNTVSNLQACYEKLLAEKNKITPLNLPLNNQNLRKLIELGKKINKLLTEAINLQIQMKIISRNLLRAEQKIFFHNFKDDTDTGISVVNFCNHYIRAFVINAYNMSFEIKHIYLQKLRELYELRKAKLQRLQPTEIKKVNNYSPLSSPRRRGTS